ncbi:hypothetical protein Cni_G17484 [Canna indica]|uniref:Uncharacterized protein n=1 Tax=Canna indica TaxID=4628 RepID=A0AAQ3QGM6_9LILI|nr:hypothetical protein Cni_G17484 [Canna indica]
MGRPASSGGWCKRHPKHRQSTGVCPFCLREKLSHLIPRSSNLAPYLSSSSSTSLSSYSSDSDLSYASSPPRRAKAGSKLTKSQSLIIFAIRGRKEDKVKERKGKGKEKVKKKKERFWTKLLNGKKKKEGGGGGGGELLHSQTFKENPTAKWI